jgi:hypothetical protein
MISNIKVLYDRTSLSDLSDNAPDLLRVMREWRIGKVDEKQSVHFCGIVRLSNQKSFVFIPRSLNVCCFNAGQMTMAALARYGADVSDREFSDDGSNGNPNFLAIVHKLARDFLDHGIIRERHRISSKNSGKPDWKRTLPRRVGFLNENGDLLFDQIITSKNIDSIESLLADIQVHVMSEILEQHGWWLNLSRSSRARELSRKRLFLPRTTMVKLMEGMLPQLYSARAIFLAKNLMFYLRDNRLSSNGNFVYGIEDFHSVWEVMLRKTLLSVEEGWNSRLPKPTYFLIDGKLGEAPRRGMRLDIVLRSANKLTIADAKYYEANSSWTAPGWPDISKQLFYEIGLRAVVNPNDLIRNVFVFPWDGVSGKPLREVRLVSSSGQTAPGTSTIECVYLDIGVVMKSYIDRVRNISL